MKLVLMSLMAGTLAIVPTIYQTCETDNDGDGFSQESGLDCNDDDPEVYTGAPELCDEKDNDCDEEIDEEPVDAFEYYLDADHDGYGAGDAGVGCEIPDGYTVEGGDCADEDPFIYPGAPESVGDTVDSNCNGHSDHVSTIAGSGVSGYSGDDGPATEAELTSPFSIVEGADGVLYLSDAPKHVIRKIDTSGVISTFAGTGVAGSSGDNGLAANAQLSFPRGLALDDANNLYIADSSNHKVRKIDGVTKKISTFVGNGVPGYGGDGGSPTAAYLAYPYGVAIDVDNTLFIADSNNHRIRMVADDMITTIAGTGSAGYSGDDVSALESKLNYPRGVALDSDGNLYIADTSNYRIRMVDGEGLIHTLAGNGLDGYSGDGLLATEASLNDPYGVAVNSQDRLYIADTNNHRIRLVYDGVINTVVGTGIAGYSGDDVEDGSLEAQIQLPYNVNLSDFGDLYIADSANSVVRLVQW